MHQAEFFFYASAKDGGGVFRRLLMIPFDPTPGFLIAFDPDDESWEIRHVTWVHPQRKFICSVGEDVDPQEDWEHMKARYIPAGWTLERELCGPRARKTGLPDEPVRRVWPRWLADCRGDG
jgi:hypothetical protein